VVANTYSMYNMHPDLNHDVWFPFSSMCICTVSLFPRTSCICLRPPPPPLHYRVCLVFFSGSGCMFAVISHPCDHLLFPLHSSIGIRNDTDIGACIFTSVFCQKSRFAPWPDSSPDSSPKGVRMSVSNPPTLKVLLRCALTTMKLCVSSTKRDYPTKTNRVRKLH
jgi:hypothetical protein